MFFLCDFLTIEFCDFSSMCFFCVIFITKVVCYNICFHFVPRPASIMSLRFQNPTSFVVSGPSGVGKCYWVLRFIDSLKQLCPEIKQVVYHYKVWQAIFDRYTDSYWVLRFIDSLKQFALKSNRLFITTRYGKQFLIVKRIK